MTSALIEPERVEVPPVLAGAVELARAAAQEEAGDEPVGAHVDVQAEDHDCATHRFETTKPGYRGWHWAVTVATADADAAGPAGTAGEREQASVTVSEVVLLPGPDALVAPDWVPWQQRVRSGDLGVGDLLPPSADDHRLVPGYLASDDPAVEEVSHEVGLGRMRVMSREGRMEAAERWQRGEYGPRSDMARGAPAACGTCGFFLPLAGSLRAGFGVCGNEVAPADGHVVHVEYGCGAHSEIDVDQGPAVPVADLVYDDSTVDTLSGGSGSRAAGIDEGGSAGR